MKDFSDLLVLGFFGCVLILVLFMASHTRPSGFDVWVELCRQDGGTVSLTRTNHYECFKDDKIINHIED